MKVIISILHYKNVEDTLGCLKSLQKINRKGVEIKTIVVDNSQEISLDLAKFDDLSLKLVKNEKNLGFTGGHNTAYKSVVDEKFDIFLILNNDCIVGEDFLIELIRPFENKEIGATVPKIYFEKGKEYHKENYSNSEQGRVIWFGGGKVDWSNVKSIHIGVDEVDKGQFDKEKDVDFATGACLAIRKSVLDKIGFFDEKFFLYYEDADLCARIIKGGFKILYVPRSIVWHKNAGSSGSGSELHDYYLTRNRMLFGIRYAPSRTKIALLRESLRLFLFGRKWQKIGIKDFYTGKFNRGSYIPKR